jgi:hypothetical protein
MFTIKNMFSSGKWKITQVFFDQRDAQNAPKFTPSNSVGLQDLWEKSKWVWKSKEREVFLEELKKVTEENKAKHESLVWEIDFAILSAEAVGDKDELAKLKEFKRVVEEQYKEATKKYETEARKARESYETYRGTVGLSAQTEAIKKLFGVDEKTPRDLVDLLDSLKHVNISSLLVVVKRADKKVIEEFLSALGDNYSTNGVANRKFRELGYSSDGALGNTEQVAVAKFLDTYLKNTEFKQKVDTLVPYAESGLDVTIAQRDSVAKEKLTPATLVAFLSDIPGDRYLYQMKGEKQVRNAIPDILSEMYKSDPSKFATTIWNILGINNATPDSIVAALKANPALKWKLFDALNANAANGIVWLRAFLSGKWAEKAEEAIKLVRDKADTEIKKLKAIIDDTTKPESEREKAKEILKSLDKKWGTEWLTGEIQKVAQGAFVNIGKDAMAVGAGVTYEAFIRWLTVTLGAAYANNTLIPAAVIHYDIASGKLGETDTREYRGNVGAGMSISAQKLFPVAIPFIDGGITATDKIQTLSNGRGGIDSIGVNAQWSKVGWAVSLSYMKETMSELEQSRAKLMEAVNKMSELKWTIVTDGEIKKIITDLKLTASDAYISYWTNRVNEVYRLNNVNATTSSGARSLLLMGLVNSELEKAEAEESQNDRDGKSFKGGSVGVANIFGVTFPIVWLVWKEGKLGYPVQVVEKPSPTQSARQVAPTGPAVKIETPFEKTYDIDATKKVLTFKSGEKPLGKVELWDLGTYDSQKWVITLKDLTFDQVVMTPTASKDNQKLDSITIARKEVAQKASPVWVREGVQDVSGYASLIYALNRNPAYKSVNKAILLISEQKYDEAFSVLEAFGKKDKRIADLLTALGAKENPSRLQILNTFTYGAEKVKNATQVDKKWYEWARRGTIDAEKRLAASRWNEVNEAAFVGYDSHTPKQLSDIISGQELSASVFATPLRGAHRIDKYTGSITVSEHVSYNVVPDQQEAIIGEHKGEIDKQIKKLNAFINNAGVVIDDVEYAAMLKTGVIPEKLTKLGISFDKKPVFFEARAMAGGNICMNKTEGIGYPTFKKVNTGGTLTLSRQSSVPTPVPSVDQPFDLRGGQAVYGERESSLTASFADAWKERDRQKSDTRTDITVENVTVSPTNITVVDGTRVLQVVNSGWTQTNIPLTSLTRDQAIALTRGQSVTLSIEVRNTITTYSVIPGNVIPRGQVDTAFHLILSESFKSEIQNLVDQKYFDKK